MLKSLSLILLTAILALLSTSTTWSRAEFDNPNGRGAGSQAAQVVEVPYCATSHRVGQIVLAIINNATFGTGFQTGTSGDCFGGGEIKSCEYPKGSNSQYLFAGAFWIGAVLGRDTAVSVGADGWSFTQEIKPFRTPMYRRSIIDPEDELFENAISEEDFIATYTDTYTVGIPSDPFGQPHRPLGVGIVQSSYAWSYSYAEDFVLFDYQISNIGVQDINDVYMGIYVDGDVCFSCDQGGYADDVTGFLRTLDREFRGCTYTDTVNIAWLADNDGDLGIMNSVPHVTGTRIVRTPAETLQVSYNWWISNGNANLDFGPRERGGVGRLKEDFRDFNTGGVGTPEGDRNKYYIMRNREFDYDQARVASIGPNDSTWLYPLQDNVQEWATGLDTRYLLSFGPFTIRPGQTLPLSFAYVGGKDLHSDPDNIDNLPGDYDAYYENLDFSDLGENATWASWIYDNPGVDTDSDGYFGEYIICTTGVNQSQPVIDTNYISGDGIPDFRGASPPPAPDFWLHPSTPPYPVNRDPYGRIKVVFNGLRSETTRDAFSNELDFEGYRIYVGRDNRAGSFSMVTSADVVNYNKFVFVETERKWQLLEAPFTADQLNSIYGIATDPDSVLQYTRANPFSPASSDSQFYFAPQDFNVGTGSGPNSIQKVYPNQPYPSTLIPSEADPDELTPEGRLKYFEYEYFIDDLLPSVPWYVNVTAFDYGSPESGLEALETSVTVGAKYAYPLATVQAVDSLDLEVFVYPNPYRIDAGYRRTGFEGRSQSDRPDNRVRQLHFANLPAKCRIQIFTIDGDLVREINHDKNPSDPNASHDEWDLITRNTQMVVSGIYYYVVEAEGRETQIGKFAIIM